MKRLLFVSILFIVCSTFLYGQDTIENIGLKTEEDIEQPERVNAVFFAPLNLFDFVNPNFQIGYERLIAPKWTLQVEAGIIINHSLENCLIDWLNGQKVSDCPYTKVSKMRYRFYQ